MSFRYNVNVYMYIYVYIDIVNTLVPQEKGVTPVSIAYSIATPGEPVKALISCQR